MTNDLVSAGRLVRFSKSVVFFFFFFFFFFVCLEIAILKKIATFGVFYCVVHLPVHVRTKNMQKIWLTKTKS